MDPGFLTDRYKFELDRKDKLTSALTLPAGVVSGLGGLIAAMARTFTYQDSALVWMFVLLVVPAVAALFVCLWNLAFAYHGQSYEYLPKLGDLAAAEEEFRKYHLATGRKDADAFTHELARSIIKAADRNTESNDRRNAYLHRASIALFTVLVFTALAGIPYVVDQARKSFMPNQNPPPRPASTQNTPQASIPQKPSFPENRVIKEGNSGAQR